jgi:methylase of polypeptide subunit release factors
MQMQSAREWQQHPFRLDQCDDLTPLRQALEAVGYSQQALSDTAKRQSRTEPLDMEVILRRTVAPTPFNTLTHLFFLGQTVSVEAARAALAPMQVEPLVAVGLLQPAETGIRATAMIFPYEGLFVAYDFPTDITRSPLPEDYVLGVGGASITLDHLTVRRQGETVLDLGTGSGVHALLAAQHANQVIATDLNPRALNFAGLNARLNGRTTITLRQGSLYEPVAEDQFDLIVANPPFVISPESRYIYRDSDLPGDTISEHVVRGAPARLRHGGYGVVLCNWYHQQDQTWSERPRHWVEACGCDVWILCFNSEEPLTYAASWLRASEGENPQHYGQLLDEWLAYYQHMGIAYVNSGAVIFRKRTGRNWIRTDEVPSGRGVGSCSAQIQRIFAAQDLLESLTHKDQLLDQRLVLPPEHRLEHVLKAEDGDWSVKEAVLKQEQGLEFTGQVDRLVATVLAGCDGRHALREMIADVAQGLGVDFAVVAPPSLRVIRQLMQLGFLSVAEPPK